MYVYIYILIIHYIYILIIHIIYSYIIRYILCLFTFLYYLSIWYLNLSIDLSICIILLTV